MIDPTGHEVSFNPDPPERPEVEELSEFEAINELEDCLESGLHNTRTDDDGYCERCGFRTNFSEGERK